MPVGALGAHEDGDAQPGVLQHILLDLVADLGRQRAVQAGGEVPPGPGVRPVQAVQGAGSAEALHLLAEFLREGGVLPAPLVNRKAVEPLGELADLFPQGHALQEVCGLLR